MTRLHRRIETRLPIERAFAHIADFSTSSGWDPGIATSERLDPGAVRVGSRFRLGVRMQGRVSPMEYRITVLDPDRRVVLEGVGSMIRAVDEIRFEATAGGTAIDYTADIRLGGLLGLAQPFLGRTFDKITKAALDGMLERLNRMADEPRTA
jgi:carbon monoxide dehydrogenase subunit G